MGVENLGWSIDQIEKITERDREAVPQFFYSNMVKAAAVISSMT